MSNRFFRFNLRVGRSDRGVLSITYDNWLVRVCVGLCLYNEYRILGEAVEINLLPNQNYKGGILAPALNLLSNSSSL